MNEKMKKIFRILLASGATLFFLFIFYRILTHAR